MARIFEIILIVLILRAVFSIVLPMIRGRPPGGGTVKRYEEDRFDNKKKMDIVDGEFKELK